MSVKTRQKVGKMRFCVESTAESKKSASNYLLRVKQLVQKLASTLANRYENWCVTNFAGTTRKKLDPLLAAAKIRKAYTSNGTILPCLDKRKICF